MRNATILHDLLTKNGIQEEIGSIERMFVKSHREKWGTNNEEVSSQRSFNAPTSLSAIALGKESQNNSRLKVGSIHGKSAR